MQPASEKLKIVINAGSNGLSFATTVAVTFFVQPILVHGLGDERFGLWLLVNSILAYVAIEDLVTPTAVHEQNTAVCVVTARKLPDIPL